MKQLRLLIGTVCLLWTVSVAAGEITVKVAEKEPPQEISEPIRKALTPKVVQLLEGETPIYEFWFREEIPLQSKAESTAKSLQAVEEISLLGVVSVGKNQRDYKDSEIIPGIYTVRLGLQPQDGDHLGTSDYPFFAVLIPAKSETAPDGIKKYRAMVKASGKATTAGHPAVLSLRPTSSAGSAEPKLTTPVEDHKAVQLQLPATAPGSSEKTSIVFELVFEGKYKG